MQRSQQKISPQIYYSGTPIIKFIFDQKITFSIYKIMSPYENLDAKQITILSMED